MNMNFLKIIYFLLLLIFASQSHSQIHAIYLDEIEEFTGLPYGFDDLQVPYNVLKDSLPDGQYIIYDFHKSDSNRFKDKNYVLMKGSYKNRQRHGQFEFFRRTENRNNRTKRIYNLTCSFSFEYGLINGTFNIWNNDFLILKGNYLEGNKNGFFLSYSSKSGELESISVFQNNKLVLKSDSEYITVIDANPSINRPKIQD